MNVTEAVQSRRSVRAFLDEPVDRAVLERVLTTAQRSPSGGNTQPWNAQIITGEPMQALFQSVSDVLGRGKDAWSPEYDIYPKDLDGAYEERRRGVGEDLYTALDIARDNKAGRLMWFANNFRAFGAPVMMLIHTPKYMGPPQWSDIGMWLQTIMLLLREEGLDSCAQEAWAMYSKQIRAAVPIPDDHIFFCGMGIGYRDPDAPVNQFDVARAELGEAISWHGFN
ncbi:nitroreductase [Pontixanthobacter aestiaquae]|uniref:Nitroreductase n=1 Tax=Pontixanthobacter aestiaquae TaxID=1509367 RepID=A0A844Z995_9SPHN|nr:nitroreductase [Pontixanthobacter aestiaquae]MDN3644925.1 nitroreductase [Pontixanthobacter aestiaquae]MXO84074.1 nitroreductase [Pontixanthobacter aestiaquae]